jgi:hypothetical protein
MSASTTPSADSVAPAKVWAALNADLQGRVLCLLAQLAFNLLITQTESPVNKETSDAHSSEQSQNPA